MTKHSEQLQYLLDELGPSTDAVIFIEQAAPNLWLIVLEDAESAMALRLDEESGLVTLACELGRPQPDTQHRIYEALLTYNGLAELHGGIRMGIREPGGAVVQEFDFHIQTLLLNSLRQIILDFSRKAQAWEEIIESAEPSIWDTDTQGLNWDGLRV